MKKYLVALTEDERAELRHLLVQGHSSARKQTHARILLKADSSARCTRLDGSGHP